MTDTYCNQVINQIERNKKKEDTASRPDLIVNTDIFIKQRCNEVTRTQVFRRAPIQMLTAPGIA